ncbi:NAD(P)H-hydrate dehydratase [Alicyclobacillus sp. ALC3]|uniref:NAD(P)H-hydrate dehydratase n=1 Tax=Alicyclobacillus sp. ALC3 TaxID=2796143 RepID=UPI00237A03DA|nr:NAD(P)H-hydrate dehydratase [Alicyclobacillus sp. ALC3]WDL95447.1 NAD(P)H-hydrate dehydratase [Alicyclobacillus sp. ALC3]
MILVTSERMQELDRQTMERRCVPGLVLMDHAGKAIADRVLAKAPKRVVVLCGKGNNGGDGWAAARWLAHKGVPEVDVVSLIDATSLQGDALAAAQGAVAFGVRVQVFDPAKPLPPADVYVDALLGTGATRPLSGRLAELVEVLGRAPGYVIAADVPTGVNATTGEVPGVAVHADETVAMAAQKLGTAVTPGCLYAGEVVVADIGIYLPQEAAEAFVTAEVVRSSLSRRREDSHKGSFGRLGVVVGEMSGAAQLAGLGAARVGAGLVVLGWQDAPVPGAALEFVQRAASDGAAFADCQALVLGPGLGRTTSAVSSWWHTFKGPLVLDADGLRLCVGEGNPCALDQPRVLTPHPKECARLLGWTVPQVQARRVEAARAAALQTGSIVVLKGYRSIIAHPDGRLRVNPTGDASLATAGTGDVLAGVIGGLLAQGAEPFAAASAGAWLHGRAGELAGALYSEHSVMATDVTNQLARAIRLAEQSGPDSSSL